MMIYNKLITLGAILTTVLAIDCSAKELKDYNFDLLKGTHYLSNVKDTPPSKTNSSWYFGICEVLDKDVPECPKNSDICGITTINLDKNLPIVSEIIAFPSDTGISYEPLNNGITVKYKGANWGVNIIDAEIRFICGKEDDGYDLDEFVLNEWDGESLLVSVKTKAACITSQKDKDKQNKDKDEEDRRDEGEHWGWFTWIFIFLVLFLSFYIIGGAWYQYNKGISIDFQTALLEVLQNFVELLKGLPAFFKEIVERVTGNSNRGEYSAV